MLVITLAIPFYSALLILIIVIIVYLTDYVVKLIKIDRLKRKNDNQLNLMRSKFIKIITNLDNAKIYKTHIEIKEEPSHGGMITNIGKVLGDYDKNDSVFKKTICHFELTILYEGENLKYRSPKLQIDETTLLFFLNKQKRTIAYLGNQKPREVQLELGFLPDHVLNFI